MSSRRRRRRRIDDIDPNGPIIIIIHFSVFSALKKIFPYFVSVNVLREMKLV